MRIVRHPNIVELKAFYYSNGDRVCVTTTLNDSLALFPGTSPFLPLTVSPFAAER
jgi:hypothetical protein